ncbi:sugar phosphate isomerase/epimerase family protein [Sphaerisporangium corydalis]|uniref:Sugar phosphate isomerase/epimerase family protein n=1 Tax=Sphaerisporangium corydalis TaxID=1441875 RepID=A0ABV9ENW4_9ACTN|nr:sugar phosphate isomerase/epimerase family protein [Sphaerisporangium corydalis]
MTKLAFSTLGCPGWPLEQVASMAARTGWPGLELRSAPDEPVHRGLTAAGRRAARSALAGVTVLCVASYVKVAAPPGPPGGPGVLGAGLGNGGAGSGDEEVEAGDEEVVSALLAEAELARDLGAAAVRVFPGGQGDGQDDRRAVRRLRAVAPRLPDGVEVWLETHDSHPRGRDVARVLAEVGSPRVRAIWDAAHPWLAGETVAETAAALAPWLAHVQVKDRASVADPTPVPLGDGVLPLRQVLAALRELGYGGWVSLEWEHKWHPSATSLEHALQAGRAWLGHPDPG